MSDPFKTHNPVRIEDGIFQSTMTDRQWAEIKTSRELRVASGTTVHNFKSMRATGRLSSSRSIECHCRIHGHGQRISLYALPKFSLIPSTEHRLHLHQFTLDDLLLIRRSRHLGSQQRTRTNQELPRVNRPATVIIHSLNTLFPEHATALTCEYLDSLLYSTKAEQDLIVSLLDFTQLVLSEIHLNTPIRESCGLTQSRGNWLDCELLKAIDGVLKLRDALDRKWMYQEVLEQLSRHLLKAYELNQYEETNLFEALSDVMTALPQEMSEEALHIGINTLHEALQRHGCATMYATCGSGREYLRSIEHREKRLRYAVHCLG